MDYSTDDAHSVYFYPRAIYKQKHIYMLIMYNEIKIKKQTQNNESLPWKGFA